MDSAIGCRPQRRLILNDSSDEDVQQGEHEMSILSSSRQYHAHGSTMSICGRWFEPKNQHMLKTFDGQLGARKLCKQVFLRNHLTVHL